MRALGSGIERTFAFLSIQFDAALYICLRPANWLEGFREFHAKANEIVAYPNEIILHDRIFVDRLEAAP